MAPDAVAAPSGNKPILAVRLDAATRNALRRAAEAAAITPSESLGTAVAAGASFEPSDEAHLHMDFVLCSDLLAKMPMKRLHSLQEALQKMVGDAAEAVALPMSFQRFELYAPDKNFLVARFKVPEALTLLRRAVWRECRSSGIAFPDAMWMPHVKLGKIKGLSRGQLNEVSCDGLAPFAPLAPARPLGLFLRGGALPEQADPGFWDQALLFAPSPPPPLSAPAAPSGRPASGRGGGRGGRCSGEASAARVPAVAAGAARVGGRIAPEMAAMQQDLGVIA